jgi:hypothetical protein
LTSDRVPKKKIVVPAPKDVPATSGDAGADNEALDLGSGKTKQELAAQANEREHARSQKFKDHFEMIAIVGLWLAAVCVFVIGVALAMHMLIPEHRHWLSGEQIASLKGLFTGGLLAGLMTNHFKKRF